MGGDKNKGLVSEVFMVRCQLVMTYSWELKARSLRLTLKGAVWSIDECGRNQL